MYGQRVRTAALSVVVFVAGQLLALHHQAAIRHVACTEHGEQIEAPEIGGVRDDGAREARFVAVEGGASKHQDCAIVRLLRTSARASFAVQLGAMTTTIAHVELPEATAITRTIEVIAVAPKTSPPV